MKRLLLVTSGLMLVMPDIAFAQQQDQHRPPGGGSTHQAPPQSSNPRPRPPSGGPNNGHAPPPRPQPQPSRPPNGGHDRPPPRPQPQPPHSGGPSRPPGGGHDRPPPRPQPRPPVHRPGSGRPPNFHPVHGPAYRYPHGYNYRRWSIGLFLPSVFLSSYYYYDGRLPLGVGAPPPGYRWVRYGPDLLLVQIGTRRIVDVIYGAFY